VLTHHRLLPKHCLDPGSACQTEAPSAKGDFNQYCLKRQPKTFVLLIISKLSATLLLQLRVIMRMFVEKEVWIMRTIIKKGAAHSVILWAGFLILIIAVLVLPSMTNMAFSMDGMQRGAENTLYGEVVAVDNTRNLTVLTVQPDNIDTLLNNQMNLFVNPYTVQSDNIVMFPNDEINIFVNPHSMVKICSVDEPARDVKVIQEVTITYHEVAGLAVADSVKEHC
jgi:hypothetical protein